VWLTKYLTNAQSYTAQQKLHCTTDSETYKKNEDSESNSYTLIQGQVAGSDTTQYTKSNYKKRTDNNILLQTRGPYHRHRAQKVVSYTKLDQTYTQAKIKLLAAFLLTTARDRSDVTVELLLLPGVTRHINKFLCKATQKMDGGLAIQIYTSGLNCNWFKVVIALEVMVFLAYLTRARFPWS